MRKLVLIPAVAVAALLAACGPTDVHSAVTKPSTAESTSQVSPEDAYIASLDEQGIGYSSREDAIAFAQEACAALDRGATTGDVAATLQHDGGYSPHDAAAITVAVRADYCPAE